MRKVPSILRIFTLLLLGAPALAGCATLFTGTTDDLRISSTPAKAYYRVITAGGGLGSTEGQEIANGTTPGTITLSRKNAYLIKVKLAGYQEATVKVNQDFNYWVICSAVCGLVPAGIDVLSGAFWTLETDQIALTLVPARKRARPAAPPPTLPGAPPPPPSTLPPEPLGPTVDDNGVDGDDDQRMYLVLYRRGDDGQLRNLVVPMVPEVN